MRVCVCVRVNMFAWHTHTHTMGTGRWAWLLLARLANNRSEQSVFAYILLRDSRRQRAIVAIAVFTRHIVLCVIICANVLLLLLYTVRVPRRDDGGAVLCAIIIIWSRGRLFYRAPFMFFFFEKSTSAPFENVSIRTVDVYGYV